MNATNYVTAETFERLKDELQHMKGVDRPAASSAIAEAREKGDLKENAEYDAAKEAQGMLEAKIKHLTNNFNPFTFERVFLCLIFIKKCYDYIYKNYKRRNSLP